MGLMDVFRAGVKGTAAARTGYLVGEQAGQEKQKRDKLTAFGIDRQSRLDKIAAERATAEEHRANAQADYYERRDTTPKAAPHTVNTDKGIMQWDAAAGRFVPTGMKAPPRAGDAAAARTEQRAARQQTKDAATGVERQIDNTRAELRDLPNMLAEDSTITRIGNEKTSRLDSLTHVSDSLNAEVQTPGSGAKLGAGATSRLAKLRPASAPDAATAAYADAADAYQQALREAKTPGERAAAKSLYDRAVARLARTHGQMK